MNETLRDIIEWAERKKNDTHWLDQFAPEKEDLIQQTNETAKELESTGYLLEAFQAMQKQVENILNQDTVLQLKKFQSMEEEEK